MTYSRAAIRFRIFYLQRIQPGGYTNNKFLQPDGYSFNMFYFHSTAARLYCQNILFIQYGHTAILLTYSISRVQPFGYPFRISYLQHSRTAIHLTYSISRVSPGGYTFRIFYLQYSRTAISLTYSISRVSPSGYTVRLLYLYSIVDRLYSGNRIW